VAPEVPASQLGHRLIPLEPRRGGGPIGKQGVGWLLAAARAAADQSLELGIHRDVRQLPGSVRYSGALEMSAELATGETPVVPEGALDDTGRAGHDVRIQAHPAIVGGHDPVDPGPGELQHPSYIGWGDEVPGGAQEVSAEDASPIHGALDGGIGRALR
jgi:hypothetical protein